MAKYYVFSGNIKLVIAAKNEDDALLNFIDQCADSSEYINLKNHVYINETGFESFGKKNKTASLLKKALIRNISKMRKIQTDMDSLEEES